MHWSGCPAGCGNHAGADIGLLGKNVKIGDEIVDAVDVFVGGGSGPNAKAGTKILEDVPCSDLPRVLEQVMPYRHQQAHRQKHEEGRGGQCRSQGVTGFDGVRVALLEARMAGEMAALVRRYGGSVRSAPAVSETPIDCADIVRELLTRLEHRPDASLSF